MAVKIYALPDGVAGTEAVGGVTHVTTEGGWEGAGYWTRVYGGTMVDGEFTPAKLLAPQTIHISADAFEAWCAAPVEEGGRGRALCGNGFVEWTREDLHVYALNQWLSE